jgi:hypothetical protein
MNNAAVDITSPLPQLRRQQPMNFESDFYQEQLALNKRVLILAYQIAWYFTLNLMDDAAILATIFT